MADIALSVTVTRELLGLPPLEISSRVPYYLATQFLGAQVTYNRQKASSIYVDGEVTTGRAKQNPTEQIGIELLAPDAQTLKEIKDELVEAFSQDQFVLTAVFGDGATYSYLCEAADYQDASWTSPRLSACQGQVLFAVPRRPNPLVGVV